MSNINRNIRVPIKVVNNNKLTYEDKLFYAILLDSIISNEIAVINREITTKEKYMLKKLKQQKAIEDFKTTKKLTTVKFDLKGFVVDEIE